MEDSLTNPSIGLSGPSKTDTSGKTTKMPGETTSLTNKVPNPEPKTPEKQSIMSQEKEIVPRFLVIKRSEGDFEKVSPFLLSKLLFGLVGELKSIKKIREGLLVETVSATQALRLMKATTLGDMAIQTLAHRTLNISKGVVFCRDLLNCSVEEICSELKSQGVIEVRRIKTRINGDLKDTANHVLTFNTPKIPAKIKVAYYSLNVRLYIPAPMRCFRCQKFGHTATRCSNEQVCVCGKKLHEGTPCDQPVTCVNCKGPHNARSRDCPVFKQEVAIQELKAKENITYPEARKKVIIPTPRGVSYAKAASTIPKMDTTPLVQELIPQLVSALKSVFVTREVSNSTIFPLPQRSKRSRPHSPTYPQQSEKRPHDDVEEIVSDESTTSQTSQTSAKKRGKGWPKGVPRKPRPNTKDDAGTSTQSTSKS